MVHTRGKEMAASHVVMVMRQQRESMGGGQWTRAMAVWTRASLGSYT